MAKRSRGWTEAKISKYQKEGRGQGEGKNYIPWLSIQNVPSNGRVHRIMGFKTNRIHHLLSDLERDFFYLLEWADEVIDIREQYPLNRELTMTIADEFSIRHPKDNVTQTPIVMTTDFLVTLRRETKIFHIATTIKPAEHLNEPRTLEKFEIERVYWERNNVNWSIVTELDLPKFMCRNIGIFQPHFVADAQIQLVSGDLFEHLRHSRCRTLTEALSEFEMSNGLEKGEALTAFKHLVATKQIRFDMHTKFSKGMLMSELGFISIEETSRLRRVT